MNGVIALGRFNGISVGVAEGVADSVTELGVAENLPRSTPCDGRGMTLDEVSIRICDSG